MTSLRPIMRILLSAVLALTAAGTLAQSDPPARAGGLSLAEGSVVMAPSGETEWTDAALNRPVTAGDRLWTDPRARAEVQLGSAVLHIDELTFLQVLALDDGLFQANLHEGTAEARVRELNEGETFEVDTPQLALRITQPGDYRIDVDPASGTTKVSVRGGAAMAYGSSGRALRLAAGQQLAFAGSDLEQVALPTLAGEDSFDVWAQDLNRRQDESLAARFVPLDVVGYTQLDMNGTWAQEPAYGAVWYPAAVAADWAPYRYGHWAWIRPWGWTWIDNARWGFAPFHYGRWALIGSRWAWVPGRLARRPLYAPALVAFIGGANWNSAGGQDSIAWYPLAPGEVWNPVFRASPRYLHDANQFAADGAHGRVHRFQTQPVAVTGVRMEDFSRGRPVHQHWQRATAATLARAQVIVPPVRTEPPVRRNESNVVRAQPPMPVPAAKVQTPPAPVPEHRGFAEPHRAGPSVREQATGRPQQWPRGRQGEADDPHTQSQLDRLQREQQLEQQRQQQRMDQQRELRDLQFRQRMQREQSQRAMPVPQANTQAVQPVMRARLPAPVLAAPVLPVQRVQNQRVQGRAAPSADAQRTPAKADQEADHGRARGHMGQVS